MDLRKLARNKPCMIRLPGCTGGGEDTCLCHYRLAGYSGMGMKPDDFAFGSWGCNECHGRVDGRIKTDHDKTVLRLAHSEGCLRTQAELRKMKANGDI